MPSLPPSHFSCQLHSILVSWVLTAKGVPEWHSDDRGLCTHPRLRVEANTTLSQGMELQWEQPEEPRAGAAAQIDASTDTARLPSAEQAAALSEHEKSRRAAGKDCKFWG